MTLKISSWVKRGSKVLIPNCRSNYSLHVNVEDKKYGTLVFDYDVDLVLCWEYIDKNFHYCYLEPKSDSTTNNCIYNLFNFEIFFRKKKRDLLVTSNKGSRIFTLQKDKYIVRFYDRGYVTDGSSFALLWLVSPIELRVFYYDFKNKFSTNIKIGVPSNVFRWEKAFCQEHSYF